MNKLALSLSVLLLGALLSSCQQTGLREPSEEFAAVEDFASRKISEVVVLPVDFQGETDRRYGFPSESARRSMRTYLIDGRSYAVPRAQWTDERSASDYETDAILTARVDKWDTSSFNLRGAIYVDARLELHSAEDGRELWHYQCRDFQVLVSKPNTERQAGDLLRAAAKKFMISALEKMPHK